MFLLSTLQAMKSRVQECQVLRSQNIIRGVLGLGLCRPYLLQKHFHAVMCPNIHTLLSGQNEVLGVSKDEGWGGLRTRLSRSK